MLPGVPLRYSYHAQLAWLKQEAAELCQVRRGLADQAMRAGPRPGCLVCTFAAVLAARRAASATLRHLR